MLLAGCSPGRVQQGPRVRIAVGGQAQLVYLPLTLAERLGYFRDEGIEVTLFDFPGGAKALEAMLGGSADVVCGFYDHTVQMTAEGKPMVAFVSLLRYPGLVLAVSPAAQRKVASIQDLRGAVVGVSAPGSSTHMLVKYLLDKNGVAPDAASIVGIGMSAGAVAAMERGKVDAAVMAEPALSQLQARKGPVRLLADLRTPEGVKEVYGVRNYPASVLYSSTKWVEGNQELALRLARAMRRTLEWIGTHNAAQIAQAMPERFRGEDMPMYVQAIEQSKGMFSPDGVMAPESAVAAAAVMARLLEKVRVTKVDPAQTYTNRLLQAGR
ncbi:MAG: ABC transporter substrate-binding protein [Acidobacteriia bacterium]|nr:ABC transporter substrate-binding protein [Terriglobia bacterium]